MNYEYKFSNNRVEVYADPIRGWWLMDVKDSKDGILIEREKVLPLHKPASETLLKAAVKSRLELSIKRLNNIIANL